MQIPRFARDGIAMLWCAQNYDAQVRVWTWATARRLHCRRAILLSKRGSLREAELAVNGRRGRFRPYPQPACGSLSEHRRFPQSQASPPARGLSLR